MCREKIGCTVPPFFRKLFKKYALFEEGMNGPP